MDLSNFVGKIVDLYVWHEFRLTGKLSNRKLNLYQITGDNSHHVFWSHEIVAYHYDTDTHRLTLFI